MFLGIEIGGTKLQLGVGAGNGTLAGLWRGAVDVAAGPEGIRQQITRAVPELLARSGVQCAQLMGVGIGFGGPVDDHGCTVIKSHQIAGWDGFPLADWIAEIVQLPSALGNDADVAGLAEALFGAGKGLSPIFYITIGSGVGGGLIIDGEIYRGCGRGAAEIGHLRVPARRVLEHEDRLEFDTLESHASGWAIGRMAQNLLLSKYPASSQSALQAIKIEDVSAAKVGEAAALGDAFALEVIGMACEHLAEGICQMIALLCPRRIIIGGGVSLMGEKLLFEPLRKLVAERVFKPFVGCYDIVSAALGEEVVVHGALALARKRFSH